MARAKAKDGADGSGEEALTQREMVRRALQGLGYDAKTQAIHDYIREHFKRNLSNNIISSYKSNLRSEAGMARGRGGRPAGRGAAHHAPLDVKDVQTIKGLVERLGANRVRELIDVFH
jgi:hypothetical protein